MKIRIIGSYEELIARFGLAGSVFGSNYLGRLCLPTNYRRKLRIELAYIRGFSGSPVKTDYNAHAYINANSHDDTYSDTRHISAADPVTILFHDL